MNLPFLLKVKKYLLGKTLSISWSNLCGHSMAIYVGTESPIATLNKADLEKGEYTVELEGCQVISKEKVFIETFFTGTL